MQRKPKNTKEDSTIGAAKIAARATITVAVIGLAGTIITLLLGGKPSPTETSAPLSPSMPIFTQPPTLTLEPTPTEALIPLPTSLTATDTLGTAECLWNWEFNTDGDREGWQVNLRVKDLRVENGALRGTWDVFDPSIISPQQLNIDTSIYKTLSIGYQIVSDDIDGQVMWTPNNDNKFSGTMHMLYGIVTDGKWHTITIQLNDDADWMATVNTIRIDPVHDATSGTFAYDYIRICE